MLCVCCAFVILQNPRYGFPTILAETFTVRTTQCVAYHHQGKTTFWQYVHTVMRCLRVWSYQIWSSIYYAKKLFYHQISHVSKSQKPEVGSNSSQITLKINTRVCVCHVKSLPCLFYRQGWRLIYSQTSNNLYNFHKHILEYKQMYLFWYLVIYEYMCNHTSRMNIFIWILLPVHLIFKLNTRLAWF